MVTRLKRCFPIKVCLFVKSTKNTGLDKYLYSECGIGFDSRKLFSFPNFDWVKKL